MYMSLAVILNLILFIYVVVDWKDIDWEELKEYLKSLWFSITILGTGIWTLLLTFKVLHI